MFLLLDTSGSIVQGDRLARCVVISRHKTAEAAWKAKAKHSADTKRANGQNAYLPMDVAIDDQGGTVGETINIDRDLLVDELDGEPVLGPATVTLPMDVRVAWPKVLDTISSGTIPARSVDALRWLVRKVEEQA